MTISAVAFGSPPPPSECGDHPALLFYAAYSKDVAVGSSENIQFDKYYGRHCKFYTVHNDLIEGERNIWSYLRALYSAFPKVTRDFRSMTVVSDSEAETHTIHIELITTPWLDPEGRRKVGIPQAFAYVLSKADKGKGHNGLQFTELRNYYDMTLLEKAKAALEDSS